MVLKERRRVLIDGLRACSHGRLEIEDSQAGMHFVAWLAGRSDAEAAALIEHARRARLGLYATTPLHLRPHDRVRLVMGTGRMLVAEIEQALDVVERSLDAVFPVSAPPPRQRPAPRPTRHSRPGPSPAAPGSGCMRPRRCTCGRTTASAW